MKYKSKIILYAIAILVAVLILLCVWCLNHFYGIGIYDEVSIFLWVLYGLSIIAIGLIHRKRRSAH